MNYLKLTAIALSLTLLTGCSFFGKDKPLALNDEPVTLDVPPNLSAPKDSGLLVIPELEITNASEAVAKRVLQEPEHVELLRDGDNHWIRVAGDRDNIWDNLLRFWEESQIKLRVDNKAHGIIETLWFSGDDKRFVAETKDKFRLRIELAEDDNNSLVKPLEIYITHYGAIATDTGAERLQWSTRERDLDLEVEFLHQLADYLDREQAKVSVSVKRTTRYNIDDKNLVIGEEFKRAWRKVGIALEQADIIISDRNRSKGIYFVTEVEFLEDLNSDRGPLDRFLFGDKLKKGKPFEVHIKSQGVKSVISIVGETMTPTKKIYVLKAIRDHL